MEGTLMGPGFASRILFASLCFLLAVTTSASAESTAEMLTLCKSLAAAEVKSDQVSFLQDYPSGICWGAFSTLQRVIVQANTDRRPIFNVCAPEKSTRTQIIEVFVEYARRNPQRLHEDFFDVAIDALRGAFPCQPRR
jgi:hypothetical protein